MITTKKFYEYCNAKHLGKLDRQITDYKTGKTFNVCEKCKFQYEFIK